MNSKEIERVMECSSIANYGAGVMNYTTEHCARIFLDNMITGEGSNVLELGPAEGITTDALIKHYDNYTVVDGADFWIEALKKRYPAIKGYVSLFEDYEPCERYDNIVLGHVLEHVIDPVGILRRCSTWLKQEGKILCAVPNSHSIHRQAAVLMGMLDHEDMLNDTDVKNGHRRVYNIDSLSNDFENAGLRIIKKGGYWLKPLSNKQIDEYWDVKMIDAFLKLGEAYPEIAGEIYIVATV